MEDFFSFVLVTNRPCIFQNENTALIAAAVSGEVEVARMLLDNERVDRVDRGGVHVVLAHLLVAVDDESVAGLGAEHVVVLVVERAGVEAAAQRLLNHEQRVACAVVVKGGSTA